MNLLGGWGMKGNANLCDLFIFFLIQTSFYQYLFCFLGKLYIFIPNIFFIIG